LCRLAGTVRPGLPGADPGGGPDADRAGLRHQPTPVPRRPVLDRLLRPAAPGAGRRVGAIGSVGLVRPAAAPPGSGRHAGKHAPMRARQAVVAEPYKVEVREVELPEPGPGQVLVRTEASFVSAGTELAVYTGTHQWLKDPNLPDWKFPFRPGYSAAGQVVAVGAGVVGWKAGDRVSYPGNHASAAVLTLKQPLAAALGTRGAEIVADATGIPDAVPVAMSLACDGGQVVVVGSPRGKAKDVNFYDDLHRRYIEVTGAHGNMLFEPAHTRLA